MLVARQSHPMGVYVWPLVRTFQVLLGWVHKGSDLSVTCQFATMTIAIKERKPHTLVYQKKGYPLPVRDIDKSSIPKVNFFRDSGVIRKNVPVYPGHGCITGAHILGTRERETTSRLFFVFVFVFLFLFLPRRGATQRSGRWFRRTVPVGAGGLGPPKAPKAPQGTRRNTAPVQCSPVSHTLSS